MDRARISLIVSCLFCFLIGGFIGCDKGDDSIDKAIERAGNEPAEDKPTNAPPTDDQLVNGPRQKVWLQLIPFSVEAPPGWEVKVLGDTKQSITMLEGPMIDETAHITIGLRDSVSGDMMKLLQSRAEKEKASIEKEGGSLDIRPLGDGLIIVKRLPGDQATLPPAPGAVPPSTGSESATAVDANAPQSKPATRPTGIDKPDAPAASKTRMWDWRVDLYVPSGLRHEHYSLIILNLTDDLYEKNKVLLNGIIDSLTYSDRPELPPG